MIDCEWTVKNFWLTSLGRIFFPKFIISKKRSSLNHDVIAHSKVDKHLPNIVDLPPLVYNVKLKTSFALLNTRF